MMTLKKNTVFWPCVSILATHHRKLRGGNFFFFFYKQSRELHTNCDCLVCELKETQTKRTIKTVGSSCVDKEGRKTEVGFVFKILFEACTVEKRIVRWLPELNDVGH